MSTSLLNRGGLLAVVTTLFMIGCDANSPSDTALVSLDLQPMVAGSALSASPTTTYEIGGTSVTIEAARLIISQITLIRADGTEYLVETAPVSAPALNDAGETVTHTFTEQVVLAKHDLGERIYELGELPAGSYTGVRMMVGLSGLTNRLDPTQVPATHALTQQTDWSHHWKWSSGYIFVRLDGHSDADGNGTIEPEEGAWDLHVGMSNMAKVLEFNEPFSIKRGAAVELHFMVDYAKMIENITDFSTVEGRNTHTMDNMPLAMQVVNDLQAAFMLHGIHAE